MSATGKQDLKETVKEKYGQAALRVTEGKHRCVVLRIERLLWRYD